MIFHPTLPCSLNALPIYGLGLGPSGQNYAFQLSWHSSFLSYFIVWDTLSISAITTTLSAKADFLTFSPSVVKGAIPPPITSSKSFTNNANKSRFYMYIVHTTALSHTWSNVKYPTNILRYHTTPIVISYDLLKTLKNLTETPGSLL